MTSLPQQGAAAALPTSSSASTCALQISKPATTLDSSDAAGTDTSASPLMNPERSPPTAASSDTSIKVRDGGARGSSALAASARRRKSASADPAAPEEGKPAATSSGAKPQRKYERKTKRFIWPDELHRLFVAAIFDVGLKNASPKALLALMEAAGPNTGLTTEHLKSHLQKYRLNYERSRNEFLEYYDRSAKRNLKRRRRHAQHRSSGSVGEGNTMFVFPISNTKRRKGHGSDTDSDSDSEAGGGNNDVNMEEARECGSLSSTHSTPRGLHAGVATTTATTGAQTGSLSYSQLMQTAQQHKGVHGVSGGQRLARTALTSVGTPGIAAHHLPPAYAAAQVQRKQGSDHENALAAAAAAAVAYRYPMGQLSVPGVAGGVASSVGMPELTDPQWSILNSLMSPQLSGMSGLGGDAAILPATSSAPATSEAVNRTVGSSDAFVLQENPSDLQMQMHLAMQAQMDLHRQMLTRKVEVSQHLARHSSMGSMDGSRGVGSGSIQGATAGGYGGPWVDIQQQQQRQFQQQQQQYHRHQQEQQQQQQEQQEQQEQQKRLQHKQQELQQKQQQQKQKANELPRPSLPPPQAPTTQSPAMETAATTETAPPTAPAANETIAASSNNEAPSLAMMAGADGRMTGAAETEVGVPGLTMEIKSDNDAMDLYRWDRIDLNVELDDDDLFSFLKS